MIWSDYQSRIFQAVEKTDASLIVEAVAGSGKTTTLVEIMNRIPSGQKACFVAFNKAIALQLESRVTNPNARCMTLHAVGWSAWRTALSWDAGNCRLDARKVFTIIGELASWAERVKYGGNTAKLVALAKGNGLVPSGVGAGYAGLVDDVPGNWEALMDLHSLDPGTCSIELARRVLIESIYRAKEVCDYEDQLYMPVVSGCPFQQYDVVMLDEAQDVNPLQIEIVSLMVREGGRLIAVGDRRQAIYGFRGAMADCMSEIKMRFDCVELPLSISYRCPKKVVAHVKQWVSQIEHSETAEDGVLVHSLPEPWEAEKFEKNDVILCRVNRPLVSLAFRLIRKRVPCRIAGRDIGKGLVDLVKQCKASTILELEERLGEWRRTQIRRAKGDEGKIAGVNDRADTLLVFMDQLRESDSVGTLISEIEKMFVDNDLKQDQSVLLLSSIHKAKGGEWERVFILDAGEFMPMPWVRGEENGWQMQQETNLMYVAATRAKRELRYITSEEIL